MYGGDRAFCIRLREIPGRHAALAERIHAVTAVHGRVEGRIGDNVARSAVKDAGRTQDPYHNLQKKLSCEHELHIRRPHITDYGNVRCGGTKPCTYPLAFYEERREDRPKR